MTCPSSKQQGYNLNPGCLLSLSWSLSGKRCQSSGGPKLVIRDHDSPAHVCSERGAWAQVEIRRPGSFLPPHSKPHPVLGARSSGLGAIGGVTGLVGGQALPSSCPGGLQSLQPLQETCTEPRGLPQAWLTGAGEPGRRELGHRGGDTMRAFQLPGLNSRGNPLLPLSSRLGGWRRQPKALSGSGTMALVSFQSTVSRTPSPELLG